MAGYQTVPQRNLTCAIRIRERRRELGLTQAEVVDRVSSHGSRLSNQALSAIENGRRLAVGRLPDLADALDCTTTYLLGLTTDPHRWPPDAQADAQATPHRWPPDAQATPHAVAQATPHADAQAIPHADAQAIPHADAQANPHHDAQTAQQSPRRNWILGPDVPDVPGELGNRAYDAPRPR